jgi:hypothetical protein
MACEFLGHEYKPDKDRVIHERVFCTASDQGCLVDDPLGYLNCTRRTFLMLQGANPIPTPKTKKCSRRKGVDTAQHALL